MKASAQGIPKESGATKSSTAEGHAVVSVAVSNDSVLPAPTMSSEFKFDSGLPCCCTASPGMYKVVTELPGVARLVEMVMKPGDADVEHEHPSHPMYVATPAKLAIRDRVDGKLGEAKELEIPAGAAPIFPPMAHQVTNVGENDVTIIFVEQYPGAPPVPKPDDTTISPFDCSPDCYTKLAEDDNWVTGILKMAPGAEDKPHNHQDHLIYVLGGDEITIYPGCDKDKPETVPIKKGAALPAPISAGPIFQNHCLKNTGKEEAVLLFFERKVAK